MTDERKRSDTRHDDETEARRPPSVPKEKLPDKRPKLGDTIEGEGSPGLSIGGGGHA